MMSYVHPYLQTYFRSVRNLFDCLIAVASLLELIFQSVESLKLPVSVLIYVRTYVSYLIRTWVK